MTRALHAVPSTSMPLWDAVACYLATLDHPESAGTRKQYGSILGRMAKGIGEESDVSAVTAADLAAWMKATSGDRAPPDVEPGPRLPALRMVVLRRGRLG